MKQNHGLTILLLAAAFLAGYFYSDMRKPVSVPTTGSTQTDTGDSTSVAGSQLTTTVADNQTVSDNQTETQTNDKTSVKKPEPPPLIPCESFSFRDDLSPDDLKTAIRHSLKYYRSGKAPAVIKYGKETVPRKEVIATLVSVLDALSEMGFSDKFYSYISKNYRFYKSSADPVLFTGYYQASLKGSRKKTDKYKYPLYQKPDDLCLVSLKKFSFYKKLKEENPSITGLPGVIKGRLANKTVVPYYTKEEIDFQGKLAGKGLEFLWVESPVDRFFLQVQGSGIVQFEDGTTQRVNYAQSNGQTYRSIGKMLIASGVLTEENVSMKTIRAHLEKNPDQVRPVLTHDPSYVFFRPVKDGPYGCFGVPVTTYRSIATDRKCFPPAALAIIQTEKPIFDSDGKITGWKPFTRFVLNQDTGGAIKSPGRVDLYCGFGKLNEETAGHMKQNGQVFFILKKK